MAFEPLVPNDLSRDELQGHASGSGASPEEPVAQGAGRLGAPMVDDRSGMGTSVERAFDALKTVVLGDDPRQQVRLARSLSASSLYLFGLVAQWSAVALGHAAAIHSTWLTAIALIGGFAFYGAIRSGLTSGLRDPALTTPQMLYAVMTVVVAYRLDWQIRHAMPLLIMVILGFGAFILPARRCRDVGWFAMVALGAAMALGVWQEPEHFEPTTQLFAFAITAVAVPMLAFVAGQLSELRIDQRAQKQELRRVMEQLRTIATHDVLTGLWNRHHVQEWMTHEIARAHRQKRPLCLAIIDLDRFKGINDTFGHGAGDDALRIFARAAASGLRAGDVLARWGGEEFLLVMPDTSVDDAQIALQRLRRRVALPETWSDCPDYRVTFSAGLTPLAQAPTLEVALQAADTALYAAKRAGRDRVFVAQRDPAGPETPRTHR